MFIVTIEVNDYIILITYFDYNMHLSFSQERLNTLKLILSIF